MYFDYNQRYVIHRFRRELQRKLHRPVNKFSNFRYASECKWKQRQRGIVIGRICEVHASSGEAFYLRMLLMRSKGATSFKDLRTVGNRVYGTFKEACDALGLLEDDNQWHSALKENSESAMPQQIRSMFVHILTFSCCISFKIMEKKLEEHGR